MIERYLKLFECLNSRNVEYLLIGGILAIAYGVPRVTKDIDIFLRPTLDNAQQCIDALHDAAMPTADLINAQELCAHEITIFKDVVRLDVLTQVRGLDFAEAWRSRVYLELGTVHIPALSLEQLIISKRAAARAGDAEDVKILEQQAAKKGGPL